MLRLLFNILASLSLLLWLLAVAMWTRSWWYEDYLAYHATPSTTYQWASWQGAICLGVSTTVPPAKEEFRFAVDTLRRFNGGVIGTVRTWRGFLDWPDSAPTWLHKTDAHGRMVAYPLLVRWLSVLPAMWVAAWFYRRERRKARILGGLCADCGYDLRASPQRCPECGRSVPRTQPAGESDGSDGVGAATFWCFYGAAAFGGLFIADAFWPWYLGDSTNAIFGVVAPVGLAIHTVGAIFLYKRWLRRLNLRRLLMALLSLVLGLSSAATQVVFAICVCDYFRGGFHQYENSNPAPPYSSVSPSS